MAVALKSAGNGNCFFNSTSILLCGDESLSDLLCVLVAGELYFHVEFYEDHEVFRKAKQNLSEVSEPTRVYKIIIAKFILCHLVWLIKVSEMAKLSMYLIVSNCFPIKVHSSTNIPNA